MRCDPLTMRGSIEILKARARGSLAQQTYVTALPNGKSALTYRYYLIISPSLLLALKRRTRFPWTCHAVGTGCSRIY